MASQQDQQNRIRQIVEEYDGEGWHRTGTRSNQHSALRLGERIKDIGVHSELESFEFKRVNPQQTFVEIDGDWLIGLPLFDGTFTGPKGVRGRLGQVGSDADIWLVEQAMGGREGSRDQARDLQSIRRNKDLKAIIVVTLGPSHGIAPNNAPQFESPFGPPVLQVSSTALDWFSQHAKNGSDVRVVAHVEHLPAMDFNVVAEITGTDESLAPVGVMTPMGGWWTVTAERVGGMVCWLEIMRAVAESKPKRSFQFIASGGHEIGHMGLKDYFRQRPKSLNDALAWIHLGASIGAAQEPGSCLYASDDDLYKIAFDCMQEESAGPFETRLVGEAGGESEQIKAKGGSYISLAGPHRHFHLESDRLPDSVDFESLSRYARAFARMAVRLGNLT